MEAGEADHSCDRAPGVIGVANALAVVGEDQLGVTNLPITNPPQRDQSFAAERATSTSTTHLAAFDSKMAYFASVYECQWLYTLSCKQEFEIEHSHIKRPR
jgi:hypothetical protein